jgi:hypothetical protein
MDPMFT